MNLWRYLDLAKFVALLQTQTLYFRRGDTFDDPFEGSYPLKNVDDFEPEKISYSAEDWRKFVAISCWHESDFESDAMWRIYATNKQGVAIKTTWEKLEAAAQGAYLAKVRYLDFVAEKAEIKVPSDVFEYKRKAFSHETEVRAIITLYPSTGIDNGLPKNSIPSPGAELPKEGVFMDLSDLAAFLDKIVVSPSSEDWFSDVVKGLVETYGLPSDVVVQSELKTDPAYAQINS